MTSADYARARRVLARDPIIGALIKQHGPCGLAAAQRVDHFSALVKAITSQQLSIKAAATIYRRLTEAMPDGHPVPAAIEALAEERMREIGYSRQKAGYIRDLCRHVSDGTLDLEVLPELDDEGVIAALTQVRGIGRWSAEMFLIFRLHRPDVLPVGDLGIVNAIRRNYRLRKVPSPERIRKIGDAWRPYRSVACWYLWRSLDNEP